MIFFPFLVRDISSVYSSPSRTTLVDKQLQPLQCTIFRVAVKVSASILQLIMIVSYYTWTHSGLYL